ncbi:acyl-CoA dehydrogenase [Sphingomonas sp. NBWT7]|uniref:acyl-CoA dehydrogenase n=1 Tax=Sphingomonas sp. NBWT7 TaxID=2596913 RepID=UPI0016290D87|nr:acyl-CoA dehydrogenase [Sphingomonas sp. NBWT7]QNE32139.1 acyl-CoA dehydrogenase [Sphingomonas sp. NBWT7]
MTEIAEALHAAIAAAGWHVAPPRDPGDAAAYLTLLRPLYAAGRRDLPLGRLLEGHVDAVQIVQRYGDVGQQAALAAALAGGAMLGVWNAALPGVPLMLDGGRLEGGKSYASGAGVLSHALVTADTPAGQQLLLLDLASVVPAIERDWWRVTGMQRSETHQARWRGAAVPDDALIGAPGCYATEPHFSGGALRFVAVHAGGIAALFDHTRDHLVAAARADDPFQAARLAELFALAAGAAATVRDTACGWFEDEGEARLARVAAARLAVTEAAERAIILAQQAVGLLGQFLAHPLAATLADLSVYVRQPAPDAQRLRVGRAVRDGLLSPDL